MKLFIVLVAPRNIKKADFETASRSFYKKKTRETKNILDSLHGNLKSSEMMHMDSISAAESIHLAPYIKDKVVINECKHQLTFFDSEIETNNGHGTECNYGQLYMHTQYSVLSLKVDLDPSTSELYDPKIKTADEYDFMEFYDNNEKRSLKNSHSEFSACSHLNESREKVEKSDVI